MFFFKIEGKFVRSFNKCVGIEIFNQKQKFVYAVIAVFKWALLVGLIETELKN